MLPNIDFARLDNVYDRLNSFGTLSHEWLTVAGTQREGYYLTTTPKPQKWWIRIIFFFYKPSHLRKANVAAFFLQLQERIDTRPENTRLSNLMDAIFSIALDKNLFPTRLIKKRIQFLNAEPSRLRSEAIQLSSTIQKKAREEAAKLSSQASEMLITQRAMAERIEAEGERKASEIIRKAEEILVTSTQRKLHEPLPLIKDAGQPTMQFLRDNADTEGDLIFSCRDGSLKAHSAVLNIFPYFKAATRFTTPDASSKNTTFTFDIPLRLANLLLDRLYDGSNCQAASPKELLRLFDLMKTLSLPDSYMLKIQKELGEALIDSNEIFAAWNFFCNKSEVSTEHEEKFKMSLDDEEQELQESIAESPSEFESKEIASRESESKEIVASPSAGARHSFGHVQEYLWHRLIEQVNPTTRLPKEFLSQLEHAATILNHPYAQILLGKLHLYGWHVEYAKRKGFDYFTKAHENPNQVASSVADYYLSLCHLHGLGVKRNKALFFQYALASSEKGYLPGESLVVEAYLYGLGVEKDPLKAFELCKANAAAGCTAGIYVFSKFYRDGIGVPRNPVMQFQCCETTSRLGYSMATAALGFCYNNAVGVAKNPQKATELYAQSAREGSYVGSYYLGICYESGYGSITQDFQKAFDSFQIAANNGVSDAQYRLGQFYENGTGVAANREMALYWHSEAADQNNESAQFALKRLMDAT